jgi:hypothetical protein
MPPLLLRRSPSLRPIWAGHTFPYPPDIVPRPQATVQSVPGRRLAAWKREQPQRSGVTERSSEPIPPLAENQFDLKDDPTGRAEAALKRWNGRRSMYLGNHRNRRDAAFTYDRPFGVVEYFDPLIDPLFKKEKNSRDNYPCVRRVEAIRRKNDNVEEFRMDVDLHTVRYHYDKY